MVEEPPPICPICGDTNPSRRYEITRFEVLECRACTQIFLYPLPTEEEIAKMFSELYATGGGSVPELKSYYGFCYDDEPDNPLVQTYESYLDLIEVHKSPGSILDVGCGAGLFLSVARRRGWEPFGIDASAEATDHAREHFGLDPWVGDFADFSEQDRSFDVITGWDIIEHAREPVRLLETMRSSLAPDGVVALTTPNQKSILDLLAGGFYRLSGGRHSASLEKFYIEQHFLYFTPETLTQSLTRANLDIVQMTKELTDLRRLTLSPPMRLVLEGMFLMARILGLENRIFAIVRSA